MLVYIWLLFILDNAQSCTLFSQKLQLIEMLHIMKIPADYPTYEFLSIYPLQKNTI